MRLEWVDASNADFITLARELDAHFRSRLGERQAAFDPHNAASGLSEVALLYDGATPAACGAIKLHPGGCGIAEVKRVYVPPAYRRAGLGRQIMAALEARAKALGCSKLVLETNLAFTEAVTLYQSLGFSPVENYGPYQGMCTLCMGKEIK